MLLKVKFLNLFAGRPVAIMHAKTAKKLAIYVNERAKIKKKGNNAIVAIVDIATGILHEDEIALSGEIIQELKLKENEIVEISAASRPKSTDYISEKLNGKKLSYEKILSIMEDIVDNSLTEAEIAYFVSGVYINGMDVEETVNLTKAMVKTGKMLGIKSSVDKHSIGGIPGNRTTPIIVSICCSAGLIMPKTSSRAITSAAGTADVIECLADVEFSIEDIKSIIKETNGCMVWGGALGLAPADDKIIQVERLLSIDSDAQLLASILAKKLAVNASHILIDIPFGENAKVKRKEALELAGKFKKIAGKLKLNVETVLTDGSQPVGNGIGPALEARDVISILKRSETKSSEMQFQGHRKSRDFLVFPAPADLENKSVMLAGKILEMAKKAKKGKGIEMAREIMDTGEAYKKFRQIIEAQGGSLENIDKKLNLAKLSKDITAEKDGKITEINNKAIAAIARAAGCPSDKSAGIYLQVHNNFKVRKGQLLMKIYAETEEKLDFAVSASKQLIPITIK